MVYLLPIILFSLGAQCTAAFYFLNGYEPLQYNTAILDHTHRRLKRSLDSGNTKNDHIYLTFSAFKRTFKLKLRPDESTFAPNHKHYFNGKPTDYTIKQQFFEGQDLNYPQSYVSGQIQNGLFSGKISGPQGTFFVEDALRYYDDNSGRSQNPRHHSIIYREEDINFDKLRFKRDTNDHSTPHTCGFHGSTQNKMREFQNSAILTDNIVTNHFSKHDHEYEMPYAKYTSQASTVNKGRYARDLNNQQQPPTQPVTLDPATGLYSVRTCTLYLQADQKLWEYVFNHEGQRNSERTRDEIYGIFHSHVKAVNEIYSSTDFNGIRGINFNVHRTTIWDNTSCLTTQQDESSNPFCDDNVDVSNFLNLNSIKNQSDYCLAYAMTYRDFVGGTLGLAWVASATPDGSSLTATSGGICEMHKFYSEGGRRVKRSLNTGIITLVNYHNRVPTKVSQLTMAHEIGHNFGSPHDFPSYCQPGFPDGNYIMFASATSGDKLNNAKFSPCSISNISAVLREVLSQPPDVDDPNRKRNCLKGMQTTFCGNGVVEEGEVCDCGFDEKECKKRHDQCCHPRVGPGGLMNADRCQLKQLAQCSPTQGPCCSRDCRLVSSAVSLVCKQASDCSHASVCDGQKPQCPAPWPRDDGTVCQENTKMCHVGSCNRSICEKIGMYECFITEGTPEEQCQLSCKATNDASVKCAPSSQIDGLKRYFLNTTSSTRIVSSKSAGPGGILLRPGSPCNDYRGYCDIFQKCRSVDSNGPLSRLKNLLFNSHTLKTLGDWVQVYWWAVVLMGVALMLLMALFIKCCAVHTPSTNPRKPPAHSIYETLRHPTTLLRQGRQPHHNRSEPSGQRRHNHRRHHQQHRGRSSGGDQNGAVAGTSAPAAADGRRRRSADAGHGAGERRRSSAATAAPPPAVQLQSMPAPLVLAPNVPAPLVVGAEPPPPYTERPAPTPPVAFPPAGGLPPGAVGGPARGHRKRKRPRTDDRK